MGTEVLRPQDFWADRLRLSSPPTIFHRRRSHYSNPRYHRRPSVPRAERPEQRRKSPSPSPSPSVSPCLSRSPSPSPPPTPQPQQKRQPLIPPSPIPIPIPIPIPRRSLSRSPSPSPPPTPQPQQKREPLIPPSPIPIPIPRRSPSADELQAHNHHHHHHHHRYGYGVVPATQMGRVRILRRGQSLDTIDATRMKRDIARGELTKKKYLDEDDVYAGSAFFASPSPSSLPLPSFFNNNNNHHHQKTKMINKTMEKNDENHDSATRDLRRLLRLD